MRNNAPSVPIILVGTKVDLRTESNSHKCLTPEEGVALQQKHAFFSTIECSAKMMNNYKVAFDKAIVAVMKHRQKGNKKRQQKKRVCSILW